MERSGVKFYLLAAGNTKHFGLTALSMAEQAYMSVSGGSHTGVTEESNSSSVSVSKLLPTFRRRVMYFQDFSTSTA